LKHRWRWKCVKKDNDELGGCSNGDAVLSAWCSLQPS